MIHWDDNCDHGYSRESPIKSHGDRVITNYIKTMEYCYHSAGRVLDSYIQVNDWESQGDSTYQKKKKK